MTTGRRFDPSDLSTITAQILAICDALEVATDDYARTTQAAAMAEAEFKGRHAQAMVNIASEALNRRTTAGEREALAMIRVRSEYQTHLITKASADSGRQALYSLQHRLDALRTLAANARAITDPRNPS